MTSRRLKGGSTRLQAGDTVRIQSIRDSQEGAVALVGHVYRSGPAQFHSGMRLTDLVGSLDELRPLADLRYALIRRETGPTRVVSVVSADLAAAFADPASGANLPLQARDRVYVFDLATSRDSVVQPIMEELRRQSGRTEPLRTVRVGGRVKVPGQYPLEPGMVISDLIRAGGGLDDSAYRVEADLARYQVEDGEQRTTRVVPVDLAAVLAGNPQHDLALQPFDYLTIKEIPDWRETETVTISGEVQFPGTYPIRRGETLGEVVMRAGGLTDLAFIEGAVFTRTVLREREQKQMDLLTERLQKELATLSLQQASAGQDESADQAMAAGRAVAAGHQVDPGDRASRHQPGQDHRARTAIARCSHPARWRPTARAKTDAGSHGHRRGAEHWLHTCSTRRSAETTTFSAAVATTQTGGREAHVYRQSGRQRGAGRDERLVQPGWRAEIRPGDTIVVPLDAQQLRPLTLWTSVTQILYNIAVAVAAVNSF